MGSQMGLFHSFTLEGLLDKFASGIFPKWAQMVPTSMGNTLVPLVWLTDFFSYCWCIREDVAQDAWSSSAGNYRATESP